MSNFEKLQQKIMAIFDEYLSIIISAIEKAFPETLYWSDFLESSTWKFIRKSILNSLGYRGGLAERVCKAVNDEFNNGGL